MKTFFQFTKHAALCLLVLCTASSYAAKVEEEVDLANITLQDTLNDPKTAFCYFKAFSNINYELKELKLDQIKTLTNSITGYKHTPNTEIYITHKDCQEWNCILTVDNYDKNKKYALYLITVELLNRLKDTETNINDFKFPLKASIQSQENKDQTFILQAISKIYFIFQNQNDRQNLAKKFNKIFPPSKNKNYSFVDLAGKSLQDEKFKKSPKELFCFFSAYTEKLILGELNLLKEENIEQIKEKIENYTLENATIHILNSSVMNWKIDTVESQNFQEKKEKILPMLNKVLKNKNKNNQIKENKKDQVITPKEPLKKQDEVFNYIPWAVVAAGGVMLVGSYLWYRYRSNKKLPFLPWKKTNKNNAKLFAFAQQKKLA